MLKINVNIELIYHLFSLQFTDLLFHNFYYLDAVLQAIAPQIV